MIKEVDEVIDIAYKGEEYGLISLQ